MNTNKSGMESIRELYKIGRGPSSSHTIGPERACIYFGDKNEDAETFKTILYGSLAKTGQGHGTDTVIKKTFAPKECVVEFDFEFKDIAHPNTMELIAYKNDEETDRITVYSVSGGSIVFENSYREMPERI